MDINSEIDDLRIKLHNLLKICCTDKEQFESAKYLMESIVRQANNDICYKINGDDDE